MKKYYTSDWHFGHRNIIRYSNRPFTDTDEMNRALVDNTKARLKKGDHLYILGDVSFQPLKKTAPLLREIKQMGVRMFLVPGNHDPKEIERLTEWADEDSPPIWDDISPLMEVNDEGRKVVLCHYSLRVWNKSHHGAYHLFGHSHGSLIGDSQSLDVGVDCWDYRPVTLDECIVRMATYPARTKVDHH